MITCATEQSFFELWHDRCAETLPATAMAELGGQIADRPAWVFVSAYQGAVRQAFPQVRTRLLEAPASLPGVAPTKQSSASELPSRWAGYLVSEARERADQPTCLLVDGDQHRELHGQKNWAAAAPHLGWLVVKAYQDDGPSANLCVAARGQGVSLIAKPSGRFLPELQVGRAEFNRVAIDDLATLEPDANFAHLFGLIEARCLLVSMAAHFAALAPVDEAPQQSLMLSSGLATAELNQHGSVAILLEAMTLLADWFSGYSTRTPVPTDAARADIQARWVADSRLLQMHRPMLERSLGGAGAT